jgi:hypothetical protein
VSRRVINAETPDELTVEESRRALAEFFKRGGDDDRISSDSRGQTQHDGGAYPSADAALDGWVGLASAGISAWWDNHPLKVGTTIFAKSAEEFARQRPMQAIAIAAGTGAALVLFRPWRLISATALVATVLKSSNLAGVAVSMLDKVTQSTSKART